MIDIGWAMVQSRFSMGITAVILAVLVLAACDDAKQTTKTPAIGPPPPPLPPAQPLPIVKRSDVSKAITVPESPVPIIPDELMVLLKEGRTETQFTAALGALPVKIVGRMPLFRMLQVEVPQDRREALRQSLEALDPVEAVTYQAIGSAYQGANDEVFTNDDPKDDWNLRAINALEAWKITPGHANVAIAILDAGTLIEHEDVKEKIIRPASGVSADGVTQIFWKSDRRGKRHGTHVAITAAGTGGNGLGTSGVCPKCSVVPVQVNLTVAMTAAALEYAIRNGARVVNMSYGPGMASMYRDQFARRGTRIGAGRALADYFYSNARFTDVIMRIADANGVVMVPAAGNANLPGFLFPFCEHALSLCAGAARMLWSGKYKGRIAPAGFSNYGFHVDVSAPGVDILSGVAEPGTASYGSLGGTSMAAPHIAGLAGLILSANPKLTARDVRRIIRASARFSNDPKRSGVKWYRARRRAEREVGHWSRAVLRLLGKDQGKLVPKKVRGWISWNIPKEHNTVWDWPYENGGNWSPKSIGPFIDARAALEMALRGDVDSHYVEFSDADMAALDKLDPARIIQLADMFRLEGRYAGGLGVKDTFNLTINPKGDRLLVKRKGAAQEGTLEAFIYQSPGRYLHQAQSGGKDYSRGPVRFRWQGAKLRIEDLIARKEVAYAPE